MYRRTLELQPTERTDLERLRNRDPRPYMRERAAALLKIADGLSVPWVARHGLLKAHHPDTVYRWLNTYQSQRQILPQPVRRRRFSPCGRRPGRGAGADPSLPRAVRRGT
jgi:hypothetical protein